MSSGYPTASPTEASVDWPQTEEMIVMMGKAASNSVLHLGTEPPTEGSLKRSQEPAEQLAQLLEERSLMRQANHSPNGIR